MIAWYIPLCSKTISHTCAVRFFRQASVDVSPRTTIVLNHPCYEIFSRSLSNIILQYFLLLLKSTLLLIMEIWFIPCMLALMLVPVWYQNLLLVHFLYYDCTVHSIGLLNIHQPCDKSKKEVWDGHETHSRSSNR